ncbi:hypothetical protein DQ04_04041020 [Trypanosoma grayi]|uniref:hypothetical protein n=1 Tax=Trypanosoma grayi TaxID=71804 RepID=UPI0004F484CF|nr:hypothetical protein DQ04_04041020 [Trypanosoma grayi]KEG10210.1 hypothetical protein DQ04_04041020 [Trypanosoma grayi]
MKRRHVWCCCTTCITALLVLTFSISSPFYSDTTTADNGGTQRVDAAPLGQGSPLKVAPASASSCTHYLFNKSSGKLAGNGRTIFALLLTSVTYHGVGRMKETLPSWMGNYLLAQGNADLVIFYAYPTITARELAGIFGMLKADEAQLSSLERGFRELRHDVAKNVVVTEMEWASLGDGYFYLPRDQPTVVFRLVPVNLTFPRYIQQNWSLLEEPTWMRCGCPPFCPLSRSSVDYIQGTRWYSHDMFDQPIVRRYSFWTKIDVDVDFFGRLKPNLVELLVSNGRLLGHTGYTYNGRGCSDELQEAIQTFLVSNGMRAVSEGQDWWLSDDRTYYTNFVVGSVNFFLDPKVRSLTAYLNEYPNGFFKHRWTDQSLLHKVMGVFCGANESDFSLDWGHLRCSKTRTTPYAVFYHSKRKKKVRPGRPCRS